MSRLRREELTYIHIAERPPISERTQISYLRKRFEFGNDSSVLQLDRNREKF